MTTGASSSAPQVREPGFRYQAVAASARSIDRAAIDARVIALFDNPRLQSKVRKLERVELLGVWRATAAALEVTRTTPVEPVSALEVHHRLVRGLAGVSLLISSAMFLNNMTEVEDYFGITFKTIKSRLEASLDTAASEKAMRAARVTMTAAEVLGSYEMAREYIHTRNFALGGATPADLLKTADGERLVLNELHAQAESGPL